MFVDWFTFIAQIVNFIILIWFLKRFLYGPIIKAIDEREKKISDQFLEANAKTEAAVKEREDFRLKNEEFAGRREAMLAAAADEVKIKRQQMLDEARTESGLLRERLNETIEKERLDLEREIIRRIRAEVFTVARRALSDLADTGLEERLAAVFIKRLREVSGDDKNRMAAILRSPAGAVSVRSAFELAPDQRAEIGRAFNETFSADKKILYETAPELICGVELTANGYRFVWSISDYIAALEKSVDGFFLEKLEAGLKTDEHRA
ncbi:MAG TPA: F0F1 ATP synthase subunit B [Candidatus Wallbacteria bacterium]|nr:F0F1 ATP synthase subunit B [Candidatus Wallbacteria bacterium]